MFLFYAQQVRNGFFLFSEMAEGNETEVRTQGYEALFHPEIDKKYMCPVCLGAMRDAMQTSCGHRFCRSCVLRLVKYVLLSYDITSGSEIKPCNKNDKPLVVYRFTGNVITSITTLRT